MTQTVGPVCKQFKKAGSVPLIMDIGVLLTNLDQATTQKFEDNLLVND